MKCTAKSDYAARALLSLARAHSRGTALKLDCLAAEHGIPPNYLAHVLLRLKARDLVKSRRGREGGYILARPPAEITLREIIVAVDEHVFHSPAAQDPQCPPELRGAWQMLTQRLEETADAITLQNLLDQGAHKTSMFYI